uniref:Uncharacterized protein n=1 Tax=Streptomyces argenteolus TaxID=67274 RepID=A9ZNU2_9ACTN|nr:hypothetical protein [Streptomyces argenteolus]
MVAHTLDSAKRIRFVRQAPASIGSALLANSIPYGKSFAFQALTERRTIDSDFSKAPYEDVRQDFLATQSIMHADRMLLTPLAGNDRASLLALYPSAINYQLVDIIGAVKDDLTDYMSSTRAKMRSPVVPAERS